MSIFDRFFSTGDPKTDKILNSLQMRYEAMQLSDQVADSLWESEDEKLDREDKRLSIAQRKRALGLPWSDDDYEKATNDGLSFTQKGALAAFGKAAADRIPAPSFLKPSTARGLMETRFPNSTVAGPLDALLSDGSVLRKGASNASRIAGKLKGISRYFRR